MLTQTGLIKVMDFGIARIPGTERMTKQGGLIGTYEYMSPEHIQGQECDARSDIYSLGILLYEMLTGRLPFSGSTEYEVMKSQIEREPVPPRQYAQDITPAVERLILRVLSKDPGKRFQTASDFRSGLVGAGVQAAQPPQPADVIKARSREAVGPRSIYLPSDSSIDWYCLLDEGHVPSPDTQWSEASRVLEVPAGKAFWLLIDESFRLLDGVSPFSTLHCDDVYGILSLRCPDDVLSGVLPNISQVDRLRALLFYGCEELKNSALESIRGLRAIEDLRIFLAVQVTDAGLEPIGGLESLRRLNLNCPGITNAGLAHFRRLKNLESLSLFLCKGITDAGIAHLSDLTKLMCLDVSNTHVGDAGLAHLKSLPSLRVLGLRQTKIDGHGLKYLPPALEELDLAFTRTVGDYLPNLERLVLKQARMT
jgi:hypothetical protein